MDAKVDIQKLQLLNDRIAQTIDALNQVRMSVYGVSGHPGMPNIGAGVGNVGYPMGGGLFHSGLTPGMQNIGAGVGNWGYPMGGGLFHSGLTPGMQNIGAGVGNWGYPMGGGLFHSGLTPYTPHPYLAQSPWMSSVNPWAFGGLLHSDPNRMAQTFPYAFLSPTMFPHQTFVPQQVW